MSDLPDQRTATQQRLDERYGTSDRVRRRVAIIASGVIGVLALVWLAWAVWFQSTPDVQSSLTSFDVRGPHEVTAKIAVHTRSSSVEGSCLVRAFALDHSTVGEENFAVRDSSGTTTRTVTIRTERKATSVDLVGCTAPGQDHPR